MTEKKKKSNKPVVRQGDKSRFVRALPRSLAAREVQALAARKGLVMSVPFIHNIRSKANLDSRALLKQKGKKTVKGGKKAQEKAFCELVIHLGPARSKALLEQVETALVVEAAR